MANFYTFNLKSGVPMPVRIGGKLILVDSIGAASGVDITPVLNSQEGRTMPGRRKGFKCWIDFDSVILQADVDTQVALFLSVSDVSIGFTEGAQVNVAGGVTITNDADSRVPVDLANGVVNVTATNVGISNDDTKPVPTREKLASVVSPVAPVAVGTVAAKLLDASAARRGARFRNVGASPVAIGGAGVTFASATDIVMPGETWNEVDAPGATWFAICDAGGASIINISTVQ